MLDSTEETEKTKHRRRFHFKTRGLWKEREVCFSTTSSTFRCFAGPEDHRPATCRVSTLYPAVHPAVCSWQGAPALFGREGRAASGGGERAMPPQASAPQVGRDILKFLRSVLGVLRVLQIAFGAGLWVTIAANKYEGSIHFVLFVAVLFWLLTLALFFLTLLDKQDLVPLLGGERWLSTNLAHDVAAAALYLPAIGVMIYKTDGYSYCNLAQYKQFCLYKVYLTAAVFACLCGLAYVLSIIYGGCRKCRGERSVI
ncbi:MARVEL domain-containing protein 1 [Betta splendens]|uniref:MARVEL domain-containing protein 1 n=1 Tax=Betta splendens TaxID=158456 RepID=A0A6P7KL86_BETSP|nr:MARVEL domain-containing protein 1 [Betta splendens]